jgi:tRNA threonylcarbamoyladenosine biosynthesis protein TsaB
MRLLAIDTALPAVSACVLDSSRREPLALETAPMERGHAEALAPLIQRVVGAVEGGFASLDRVAVTVGPGSFTGVRIGLAAAQAIALARKIDLVGVSTLAALAAPSFLEPFEGVVAAAIDARHGQVYVAAFGPDGRMLVSPRRTGVAEALRALGHYPAPGSEDAPRRPLLLVGSGAPLLEAQARASGFSARIVSSAAAADIAFVARLGLVANANDAPAHPLYLKSPDAKPVVGQGAEPAENPESAAASPRADGSPTDGP